jgi:DNA repair protein RadD
MNAPLFPPAAVEPRTLRLYQETAIDELRESLRTGHRRPILQLPTGAGKTRIAAKIVLGSISKERHAIFVVPRLSLIEQTVAAFEREGIWNAGVMQGRHFRTNQNAPVQIASAQTLVRRDIPSADIVIIDECHLQFKKISKWIASPEWSAVPFVGLSATPWSRGLGKSYDDLLRPVSIQELIAEGYLSPFRVFAPPAPDLTGVRTVAGEFHEADLSDACNTKEIVADVINTWFEKGENRPTLCYGVDRRHARHLQERFVEAGVRTEYIDCDTEMFEREEIFERFRASETKLICNVATLDTGIDLDVRCIIDARPTKSRIRFVQTIGRGLRPGEGKDHLLVLDHAGNHQRLGLVTDIHFDALDDGSSNRNLDKGKADREPSIKLCPDCRCVLPPRARECPACGFKIYAATEVLERDGELVELGSRPAGSVGDRQSQECAKKDFWHGALVKIAKQKGYAKAHGWAAHKFCEKFGHWPTLNYPPEREPTVEIINWVRSRNIAYAKAKARYG